MCGRFNLHANPRAVASLFGLPTVPELAPRYNVAPSQPVAVVGLKPGGSARGLALMRWGLVPRWAKSDEGPRPINARCESLMDRPTFRDNFRQRRCLIPASGFYEWAKKGGRKQPYHVRRPDGLPLAFAGLWDRWEGPGGPLLTCAIITTAANELVKPLHDRMPAIIRPEDFARWLDPSAHPDERLPLLRPCPADVLEAVPVGAAVNNPRNDGPECLGPAA
jgi:putative SOS response-associated peptidase YedK